MKITRKITNEIIFEDDSNTMKDCVINAISSGAYLRDADLRGAYLGGAYLGGAYLRGAYLHDADLGGANLRDADLRCADLRCADLRDADLRCADLRCAYLRCADLGGADLGGADLGGAYIGCADLSGAYLGDANLHDANLGDAYIGCADLSGAYLGDANLHDANLGDANLHDANLHDANLRGAKNIPFVPFACPSDGEFVGWKKIEKKLVKLLIPSDARRCSSTSNKCRCDKAKVLEITDLDGSNPIVSVTNHNFIETQYIVGQMVFPDSFDENRWNECSHGIHFFINKQEAINY